VPAGSGEAERFHHREHAAATIHTRTGFVGHSWDLAGEVVSDRSRLLRDRRQGSFLHIFCKISPAERNTTVILPFMLCMEATMRKLLCLLVLAAFAGLAIADVNVTGSWAGSFNVAHQNGEVKESTALLKLTQTGTDITGTVGPDEGEQFPIQKGKIDGEKITLEVDHDGNKIKFDLVLVADRITGEANGSDGNEKLTAKVDVKRVK